MKKKCSLTARHQQDFQTIQCTDPSEQSFLHHEQPDIGWNEL